MFNKKLDVNSASKLTKTLTQIHEGTNIEKSGFVKAVNKSSLFKTKSFRLREIDFINLSSITESVNTSEQRKVYTHSEVIRGIINFAADNFDNNKKKLVNYIKSSS